jgi:CBS domain-containing protein
MTNREVRRQFKKGLTMKASDVMIKDVITVKPNTKVQEVAEILVTKRISGMPVVDDSRKVVGMISEGDLLRRSPEGLWPKAWGPPPRRGWVRLLIDGDNLDTEYVTQPDRKVGDIMTYDIISAEPETSVSDIAILLMHHRIKRVPIIRNGKLVGLVSRANLIEALARVRRKENDVPPENYAAARMVELPDGKKLSAADDADGGPKSPPTP